MNENYRLYISSNEDTAKYLIPVVSHNFDCKNRTYSAVVLNY